MTKKITSFFQVSVVPKNSQRASISGIKRGRDNDDCLLSVNARNTDDDTPKIDCSNVPLSIKSCLSFSSSDHVNELLSFLCEDMHEISQSGKSIAPLDLATDQECGGTPNCNWNFALQKHFQTAGFQKLAAFVARERQIHKIYPPPASVWSALNSCPLHMVKVVIVGQDPYHGPKQAHGLSFSVEPGCAVPPSLKNM